MKGLGLRITPKGVKSYILNYRINGRERRATIARASETSLKIARERAGEQLAGMRAGEADPLESKREAREAPTVADGLRRFFDEFVPARQKLGRLSARTRTEYRWMARRYIKPSLGKLKIGEVTREEVERMMAPLPSPQRNTLLKLTSRLSPVQVVRLTQLGAVIGALYA